VEHTEIQDMRLSDHCNPHSITSKTQEIHTC